MNAWISETQGEYDEAENRMAIAQTAFDAAADTHCDDPGDSDLPVHEWPSYRAMIDAHRAYRDAATEFSRLRP